MSHIFKPRFIKPAIAFLAAIAMIASLVPLASSVALAQASTSTALAQAASSISVKSTVMDVNLLASKEVPLIGIMASDEIAVSCSNDSVVSSEISNGSIWLWAKKKGSATIRVQVTRWDGATGFQDPPIYDLALNVTVSKISISSKRSVNDSLVLYKGESAQLSVKGLPSGLKVRYSSNAKSIASVSSKGKVKAKGYGQTSLVLKIGDMPISYSVSVGTNKGVGAVRWAISKTKNGRAKYSQLKRMSKGYFDCSSLTGRSYATQGVYLNALKYPSPVAADQARWCSTHNNVVYNNARDIDYGQLRPGDLLFYVTGYAGVNTGYRHIDHVALYAGNGYKVEVRYGAVPVGFGSRPMMVGRPTQYAVPVPMASGLTAKRASPTSVKLSWKKKSGVSGYKIYRSEGSYNYDFKLIATVKGPTKKSYIDKKLVPGKRYNYQIRAYKKSRGKIFLGKMYYRQYGEHPVLKSVRL